MSDDSTFDRLAKAALSLWDDDEFQNLRENCASDEDQIAGEVIQHHDMAAEVLQRYLDALVDEGELVKVIRDWLEQRLAGEDVRPDWMKRTS